MGKDLVTTSTVTSKGQMVVPAAVRKRFKIEGSAPVRIQVMPKGFYVSLIEPPSETELAEVERRAGPGLEGPEDDELIRHAIKKSRDEKTRRSRH
ncbi:MAG: AbrB/MazE/SpoVT family DNA-binding domain-containing protein [Verrucomicrobiota bacterium]